MKRYSITYFYNEIKAERKYTGRSIFEIDDFDLFTPDGLKRAESEIAEDLVRLTGYAVNVVIVSIIKIKKDRKK